MRELTRRERARKQGRRKQFWMAALPMPHEISLETERLLSTAWDLATVTPIVPAVVVFTIRHVSALH